MSSLNYELLATDLIERRGPFSIYALLAPVLMQSSAVFPLMNYLHPSERGIEIAQVALVDVPHISVRMALSPNAGLKLCAHSCTALLSAVRMALSPNAGLKWRG